MPDTPTVSGAEAAAYLRLEQADLRRLVTNKKIPSYKVDRRVYRFKREDLDAFLHSTKETP